MNDSTLGFFKSVEEFVEYSGGDHAIKKILIANNGIGAVKAIRSIRRWSFETFGNERMIKFVAMATPDDLRANAEYIRLADEVVDVPGGSNNNNYANVTLICDIAERHAVDAVMPLWGHASENPSLPTSLLKLRHRVTFIGPPAEPMMALGDKIGSTIIAQSAGVPCISWNGDDLRVDYQKEGIPQEVYDKANVLTAEECLACCERIGYPVMIKASEGGGGKGIRKVTRTEDVFNSFKAVQGEIPGSPIFVMKMASKARHLEVQLLADKHGEAIALSGRDCSVQRRHQKIIEEGPPIAAPVNVFKKMEQAAVALAKTVGYINAGTVEYLYLEESQQYAFLELNPRLQVEHPVTENILGINLPACQLQVAMGLHLYSIGDIRRLYGRHPRGKDTIDFTYSERQTPPRHCIAVRVTAENPDAGFQPTSGKIKELNFRSSIDVWGYFSVDHSGLVHEFADSQFGHIFSSGKDRESARRAMIVALKELQIRGEIRTTIEYIVKMLQSEDFVANRIDTMWLDARLAQHQRISAEENALYAPAVTLVATVGAALKGYQHFVQGGKDFIQMLGHGHIPSRDFLSPMTSVDLIFNNIKYVTKVVLTGPNSVVITSNGSEQLINIRQLADEGYLLDIDGQSHLVYSLNQSGGSMRMILDGHTCIFTPEYDPTKLTSSVAGKLARLLVPDGSHVNAGDAFVEIEVMKMYMPLKALESGTVSFQLSEGAALAVGDLIATVTLDDPDTVVKAEVYSGRLDIHSQSTKSFIVDESVEETKGADDTQPHITIRNARQKIENVLNGYFLSDQEIKLAFTSLLVSFDNKLLPAFEVEDALSVLRGRIDSDLYSKIQSLIQSYVEKIKGLTSVEFPAGEILQLLNSFAMSLSMDKREAFKAQTSIVWSRAEKYLYSFEVRILGTLLKYIESFLEVEQRFDMMSFTDVVGQLRKEHVNDSTKVLDLCRSHANVKSKINLMLLILEEVKSYPLSVIMKQILPRVPAGVVIRHDINLRSFKLKLTALAQLRMNLYSHLSFTANLLVIEHYSISTESRRQIFDDAIVSALTASSQYGYSTGSYVDSSVYFRKIIDSNIIIRDLLVPALLRDQDYQTAAMELYIRKIYNKTHIIKNMFNGALAFQAPSVQATVLPYLKFEFITKSFDAMVTEGPSSPVNPGIVAESSPTPSEESSQKSNKRNISFTDLTSLTRSTSGQKLPRIESNDSLNHPIVPGLRRGVFIKIENLENLSSVFPLIVDLIPVNPEGSTSLVNGIHIAVIDAWEEDVTDDQGAIQLSTYLTTMEGPLKARGIRRVTFFVGVKSPSKSSLRSSSLSTDNLSGNDYKISIFTFRARLHFMEDRLYRHIEAPHAFHLELPRLSSFSITLEDGIKNVSGNIQGHLYRAVPKGSANGPIKYFARIVSFADDILNGDVETLFVGALDHLSFVLGKEEALNPNFRSNAGSNHIFINIANPDTVIKPDVLEMDLKRMWDKHWYKLVRLSVTTVEFKVSCRLAQDAESVSLRFVGTNPTGFVIKAHLYYEAFGPEGQTIFKSLGDVEGPWEGLPVTSPYPVSQKFEKQRSDAMTSSDTLYVYDWPTLFEAAVEKQWLEHKVGLSGSDQAVDKSIVSSIVPDNVIQFQELVVCTRSGAPLAKFTAKDIDEGILRPIDREPGLNIAGMVAWLVTLKTPEYPSGRQFVLISNDITHQAGSFGTKEDYFFYKASEYARVRGLPRIYIAANSGARIGMAESLKKVFSVAWQDDNDPSKGFKYIYMKKDDYEALLKRYNGEVNALPVISKPIQVNGEERFVITDIIGEEPDLGVENLMGSGLIAGATSRAYDEIFTLTIVAGRTVGIGAYLVRLGQRTIQKIRNSPIILTGYQALNKLMGREIYTTNDQLGGPMIMYPNGVSHLLSETHFDSVKKAMTWLSFVPAKKGLPLPVRDISSIDIINRPVEFAPSKNSYDPRFLLTGEPCEGGWRSGFLDKDSFAEALFGWAKTVVVGRGRLGGIPLGVIVTENRTAEAFKPADPADSTSSERMVQQAGGVWFPDSAYKTAQALRDFNRESLPCIIFANWRGFSGGQRDMFDEVLKFGSMIVDALVAYQQPIFVYIPPFAELRGGAWVVVDSTINSDVMEFYAAEDARGGVLEATGAASIKFRDRDIVSTAHRLDDVLINLDASLKRAKEQLLIVNESLATSASSAGAEEKESITKTIADIEKQIKKRERALFGVYQQVAVHFADLHDTPGRMRAKGVIRRQVQWSQSREFFFYRLKRRLFEFDMVNRIVTSTTPEPRLKDIDESVINMKSDAGFRKATIAEWKTHVIASGLSESVFDDDMEMLKYLDDNSKIVKDFVDNQIGKYVTHDLTKNLTEISKLLGSNSSITMELLTASLSSLSSETKATLLAALKDV